MRRVLGSVACAVVTATALLCPMLTGLAANSGGASNANLPQSVGEAAAVAFNAAVRPVAGRTPVRNGRLAVNVGTEFDYAEDRVVQFYSDGTHPQGRIFSGRRVAGQAYSFDGSKLAIQMADDGSLPDIFTMNVNGGSLRRLTTSPAHDGGPVFSPNGRRIAFVSNRHSGVTNLWLMRVDGTGQHIIPQAGPHVATVAWSPTSGRLVFASYMDLERHFEMDQPDLWSIRPDGTGLQRLSDTPDDLEADPTLSPDGSRIAYSHSNANRPDLGRQLWTMAADGSAPRQLTDRGSAQPAWSPNGRWIAFFYAGLGRPAVGYIHPDGSGFHAATIAGASNDDFMMGTILTWQRWPGNTPSSVTLHSLQHEVSSILVRGTVQPSHPRHRIQAVLLRVSRNGDTKLVDKVSRLTGMNHRFRAALTRPLAPGTCIIRVRYTGDRGHLPDQTSKRTSC